MYKKEGSSGPGIAGLITLLIVGGLIFLMVRSMWESSASVGNGSMEVTFDELGAWNMVQYESKTEGSQINYYIKGTKTMIFSIANDNVYVTDAFLTYCNVKGYNGPITFSNPNWNTQYITVYGTKAYKGNTVRIAVSNSTSVNDAYNIANECKGHVIKQTMDTASGDYIYYIERSRAKADDDGTSFEEWMKRISEYSVVKAIDRSPEIAMYAFALN